MTIKLSVLKSGEDIVSDMQEMLVKDPDGNDKVIGYFLNYPCVVKLYGDQVGQSGNNSSPFKIQLTPWMSLSKDQAIPVVADWVVTMMEPIDQLKEMYETGIKKYYEEREPETTSVDEQSDDSESD